jgi:hypothetical protein
MADKYSVPLEYLINLNSHSNFKFEGKKFCSDLFLPNIEFVSEAWAVPIEAP